MAIEEAGPVEVIPPAEENGPRLPVWLPVAIIFVLLSAGVAALLFWPNGGGGDPFTYSKQVHEVVTNPAAFAGRELRVEGELRQGSIQFREDPCEWRFVLEKSGHEMPVRFPQCVVPDTFRDGMGISVVVQGRIEGDGSFLANQVVPRCPSKYEMQQRQQNGEETPHDMTAPLSAARES